MQDSFNFSFPGVRIVQRQYCLVILNGPLWLPWV